MDKGNNTYTKFTEEQFKSLIKQMGERIKPCPKCGGPRQVIAIFENDETDTPCGWVQFCPKCDNDTDVEVLDITELDWKDEL